MRAAAAAVLVLLALAAQAAPAPPQPDRAFDPAAFERVLRREMEETRTPGAAAALVLGGEVIYSRGLGAASVETGEPVTDATLFRVGSTTKMFTGLAALLLADEGRLRFDAPVSRWVAGLDPAIGSLTLHALLSHTAGLINEGSASGSHDDDALGRRVRSWTAGQVFAPPGDVYSYSSPGYWLAGHVIEAAGGQPYADALAARIFAPAGMPRTTFRPLMALTYPMAQDHRVAAGSAAVVRPYPDDVSTWPGGSMFSSARELARFALALIDGGRIDGRQVFPGAAIEKLRTRQADAPGGCGYTYGLADCTTRGVRTLSHYGFRSGSGSIVSIAPAERAAIILLANRAGGILSRSEAEARRMLFGLAPAPSGGDPSGPKAAPMGPAALARLAGDYVNGSDVLTLRAAGGALTYRYRDGDEQPIKAIGPREIAVTSAAGDPVQPFLVLQGRVTGDTYLSDGLTAFRRRAAKP